MCALPHMTACGLCRQTHWRRISRDCQAKTLWGDNGKKCLFHRDFLYVAKILDGVDGPRSPASMCHNVVVGERHN